MGPTCPLKTRRVAVAAAAWLDTGMRISVDFDRCQSNALCMSAAPEVFEVRDDGFLYVLIEEPGEDIRAKVTDAARICPTQAITVEG
jgi:ferredoxin